MKKAPANNHNQSGQKNKGARTAFQNPDPETAGNKTDAHNRKNMWVEKLAISIAALAFGAAVWQGWVARDTEKRQVRAYVSVSEFTVKCCDIDTETPGYQERKKFAILTVKNGGQTPASGVFMSIGSTEISRGIPFPANLTYHPLTTAGKILVIGNGKAIMRPASFYMLQSETKQFQAIVDPIQLMRTKNGMSDTVLFGTITYTDAFGERQFTDFCRIWEGNSDGTDNYLDCPEHNGARQ